MHSSSYFVPTPKSTSRIYNEIKMLNNIYGPEAHAASLSNLRPYTDVPKMERRRIISAAIKKGMLDPQRIDKSLSAEEQWDQALPFVSTLLEEIGEKKGGKAFGRTQNLIAKQIGLGKTNCDKIFKIGNLAEEQDEITIMAMKNLDNGKWKVGTAYNVIRVRKLQNHRDRGYAQAEQLIEKIKSGETKPSEAGKFFKSTTGGGIDITEGEKYDIILIKPEGNPTEFKKRPLPLHKETIIFWLTPAIYLINAIELLQRWGFNYRSCTPVYRG